jgi:protein-S-isoprenylcysteine O-methyltransferase Ste14
MRGRHEGAAGAFTPVALVFLVGLAGGVAINLFLPAPLWPGNLIRFIGLVPLVIGGFLVLWARTAFRRHQTSLMPWTPSSALVQDGPYSFSRNPIYLAFCIMYLGASFVFNSAYILVMSVIVLVLFDRLQIPREERYLEAKFGAEFSRYKAKVRRWV